MYVSVKKQQSSPSSTISTNTFPVSEIPAHLAGVIEQLRSQHTMGLKQQEGMITEATRDNLADTGLAEQK